MRVYGVFRSVLQRIVTIYSQMYHDFQTRALLSFLCRYATIQLLDELPLGEFCVRKEFSIMDHTYQRPLQLPACCSVLSAEEMTYTEAARVMGKKSKQVDNLLYRAKRELKSILGEEGMELL